MSGRVLVVGVPKSRGADLQSALWREGLDLVWSGVEDLRDWLAGSAVDALVADLSRSDVRSRLDFERPEVPIVPYDEVPIVVGALKNLLGPAGLALSGSTVDLQTGDATTKDGRKVVLTANEIALLRFLARRRDEVIPESELLRKVWGYAAGVRSRAVASTVYRLRKKVELDPKNPVNLLSEYGRGYRLSLPARPAQARTPLPAARDGFVGRERELGQLREALSTRAIVSITGPGGVGKSRLALESLHRARASTDRKVSWVDLSDARSAADVIAAVAASIGVPLDSRAASASLGRAIAASGPLLICLDDGDNVAEELARLSSEWVDACPELVLLLTCRHPVGVLGDRQIRLRPLDVPEDDKLAGALVSDAIALLLRRTQDRAGDLRLDAGNAEALCRIVRAVDGLPLAIELVAAQAAHLPLSTLADELETMGVVAEAFEVGRPTRHGSLSTTFRWSFQHLDSVSRDVLGQLTVFDGGFTLPAADTIVDARVPVVPEIHRLVTQSWVRRRPGARFELLSLVRRFVEAETEDSALQAARARHVRHFSGSSEWPPEELRNLVSACRRHLDAGHVDPTLLQTTWFMLRRRGRYAMGLQISTLALELCRDPVSVVHVSRMVGECHVLMGRVEQGREMYDRALETARSLDDPVLLGKALASRAFAAWPDERELAYRYLNEAVRLGDAHGDPKGARLARARTARFYFLEGRLHDAKAAYTTLLEERPEVRDAIVAVNLGAIHAQLGERAEAERWFETSLGWANEVGADTTRVYIMGNLGLLAAEDGERELAETRFRAAIDMANRTGERRHAGWCQGMLGMMYLDDGDVDEAHEVLRESLDCLRVWGKAQDVAFSLARLAEVALAEDRFDSAERHLDDAHRQFRSECPSATRVDLLVVDARRRLALDDVEAASSSLRVARALVSSENLVLGSRIARRLTEAERALGQRS